MVQAIEWAKVVMMAAAVLVMLEARIRIGNKIAVIERDLEWIRDSLTKWGMVPPHSK